MTELKTLQEAVLLSKAAEARALTEPALADGIDPLALVNNALMPAMDEVGRRFECSDYFVPELLLAARAMKGALESLRPLLAKRGDKPVGRVVVGTVRGDLHDIGKNLVPSMFEGGGFEVTDLGVNVPPEKFVSAARKKEAQIVALSALLTTTMPAVKRTIDALRDAGPRGRVKLLVGGAPVTQRFTDEIGADGYSERAPGAVALTRKALAVV